MIPVMNCAGGESAAVAGTEPIQADRWFVYILRCSDDSLYTGITIDVERRTKQHNAGTASRYTRTRLPVEVEYQEPHASRSLALKREAEVKAMARLEKESLITRAANRRE
jgi:predicted GIY-YIG superfamily endonuclease